MAKTKYEVSLTGDAKGLDSAVNKAKSSLQGLSKELGELRTLGARALNFAGIGGAVSVAGIVAAARNVASLSREVTVLSQISNTGVENFQRLAYGARTVGVEQDKLADILKDVQDKVGDFLETGGGPLADFFENIAPRVGVTAEQFRNLSGPQALQLYVSSLEKANVSNAQMTFYLEAIASDSTKLLPLLRNNGAAFTELGEEAERAGVILSEKVVAQGVQLERNLERTQGLIKGLSIAIGSELIPVLNKYLERLQEANKAGVGLSTDVFFGVGLKDVDATIAKLTAQLDDLQRRQETRRKTNGNEFFVNALNPEIEELQRQIAYYTAMRKASAEESTDAEREAAAEVVRLEAEKQRIIRQLQDQTAAARRLAQQDEIAAAKEIKKNLEEAWRASTTEAKAAAQEARRLLQEAASIRQTGADRANDRRMRGMSDEERDSFARRQVRELTDSARSSSVFAQNAAIDGNLAKATQLAVEAAKAAERAEKFADQIGDDEDAARAIEELAGIRAEALETQAKVQEKTAEDKTVVADLLATRIQEADAKLVELQNKAKGIQLEMDVAEAQTRLDAIQAKLDALTDKTVTVTVNTVDANGAAPAPETPAGSFASGGFTGYGGKFDPAGIVHRGEFVMPSQRVLEPGALALLERMRREGIQSAIARLKGYSAGGLVQNLPPISMPSLPRTEARTPIVLQWPDGSASRMSADASVANEIVRVFQRASLQRGRRK